MIFFLLVSTLWASNLCENHSSQQSMSQKISSRLDQAVNLVHIAQQADRVLGQLTKSKSPVLLSWLEQKKLTLSKEDEIAKEWRKYYFDQFILRKFPTPHPPVNQTVESLFKELREQTITAETQKKLQNTLILAREKIETYLATLSHIDEVTRSKIVDRLKNIKILFIDQLKGSRFQNHPLAYLDLTLDYDHDSQSISVGPMIDDFKNDDAALLALMIYQISQSFDPCQWSLLNWGENPFLTVLKCLRENKSVLAQPRNDSHIDHLLKSQRLNAEQVQKLKAHPFCDWSFYRSPKIQQDEINSAFSHWVTAEIISQSPQISEAFFKPFCQLQNQWPQVFGTHLEDPMSKIYSPNPHVKLQWKTKVLHYCPI